MPEETPQLPVSEQEVQIEAPSFFDKLKLQKKKILIGLGVFVGVLILTGAVFGVYKYAQNQIPLEEPTPMPLPAEVSTEEGAPTTGWETYTNTNYGYSIKYPPELEIKEIGKVDEKIVDLTNFILSGQQNATASIVVLSTSYQSVISSLESEWWGGTLQSPNKVEDIIVVGIDAKRITGTQVPTGYDLFETIFPKGSQTYRISFKIGPEMMELGYDEDTFNLILSTFKFLEENEQAEVKDFITAYMDAIVAEDWDKVKSHLAHSSQEAFIETVAPLVIKNYQVLTITGPDGEGKYIAIVRCFDKNGEILTTPSGDDPQLQILKEDNRWKTSSWYLFP